MLDRYRVEPFVLSNCDLIHHLEKRVERSLLYNTNCDIYKEVDKDIVRESVVTAFEKSHSRTPGHVFENLWEDFCNKYRQYSHNWSVTALSEIANAFLESCGGELVVKSGMFADWQKVLSQISSLPVRSAFMSGDSMYTPPGLLRRNQISACMKNSLFISPNDSAMEHYIRDVGLVDTHLHLNGSTPLEHLWLKTMIEPAKTVVSFLNLQEENVRSLCRSIDIRLTPDVLLSRLRLAQVLRYKLYRCARHIGGNSLQQKEMNDGQAGDISSLIAIPDSLLTFRNDMLYQCRFEMDWQITISRYLKNTRNSKIDRYYLLYVLIKHQLLNLLIQGDDHNGFGEFQKFAKVGIRRYVESKFYDRFLQYHGDIKGKSDLSYVEGRFSPRPTKLGNIICIQNILWDYLKYLNTDEKAEESNMELSTSFESLLEKLETIDPLKKGRYVFALIAHFTKQKENDKDKYYHQCLRDEIQKKAAGLAGVLYKYPKLTHWLCGIDAADNELDAPPEVFAPVYRFMRRAGVEHVTYHVGEDFIHLITGIGSIEDTLTLLEYKAGDRLGHCTAIGINPQLWLDSMPMDIVISRREWMLGMLSLWRCSSASSNLDISTKAAREAVRQASAIFGEPISIEELDETMHYRGLEPKFVFECLNNGEKKWNWRFATLNSNLREEAHLVSNAAQTHLPHLKRIAKYWHSREVLDKMKELIRVSKDFIKAEELICFQQEVLKLIDEKRVVIEVSPTSNAMISQYKNLREHHIFRWMKIKGSEIEGDPDVMITLGSDDPGIFATNIKSEYYHLYELLRNEFHLSDREAIQKLDLINKHGRIYGFKNR